MPSVVSDSREEVSPVKNVDQLLQIGDAVLQIGLDDESLRRLEIGNDALVLIGRVHELGEAFERHVECLVEPRYESQGDVFVFEKESRVDFAGNDRQDDVLDGNVVEYCTLKRTKRSRANQVGKGSSRALRRRSSK